MKSTTYKIMALDSEGNTVFVDRKNDYTKAMKTAKQHCKKSRQFVTVWKVDYEFERAFEPE